jgi:hypothetical protein
MTQDNNNNNPSVNDMIAMINTLKAQNAELQAKATAKKAKGTLIKVSPKGGVSVYGLGRFPVTLYDTQWTKLLGLAEEIKTFIEANKAQLAKREESVKPE